METEIDSLERLDANQIRLCETIQQVRLCCRQQAACSVLQRATAMLVQRLELYLGHEHRVYGLCHSVDESALSRALAFDDSGGPEVLLRDLKALQHAFDILPACAMASHLIRLADELLERLAYERREVFPLYAQR